MNRAVAALTAYLASRVYSSTQELPSVFHENGDWNALVELAQRAKLGPLLHDVLPDQSIAPAAQRQILYEAYVHTTMQNRLQLRELRAIVQAFDRARLPVLVLKGAALANTVYGNIGLRPFSDLDILVPPTRIAEAIRMLVELGYTSPVTDTDRRGWSGADKKSTDHHVTLSRPLPHTRVELHFALFTSHHHQQHIDLSWFWQTAQPIRIMGQTAYGLAPPAQILHLCAHFALQHQANLSARSDPTRHLLWLYDILMVSHRYEDTLDWELILRKAQEYDLVLSLQMVFERVAGLWPASVPPAALAAIRALRPSATERHTYGKQRSPYWRFWMHLQNQPSWRQQLHYLQTQIAPNAAYMQQRYRLTRHWQLPLAYPYRWFSVLFNFFCR